MQDGCCSRESKTLDTCMLARMTRLCYTENIFAFVCVFDMLQSFKLQMRCARVENVMPVRMSGTALVTNQISSNPASQFKSIPFKGAPKEAKFQDAWIWAYLDHLRRSHIAV